MNEQELKQWAWDWAIRLKGDLSRTPDFFREGEQIAQKQKDPLMCSKILCWPVAAYYEYLAGNWNRQRAERQIQAAIDLMRGNDIERI